MTKEEVEEEGYSFAREIPDRGWCGIIPMNFTVGLVYGIDEVGYNGRYCFHTFGEALVALTTWTGIGDPHGNWIVRKGVHYELRNPNYMEDQIKDLEVKSDKFTY